jgi:dextranase
MKRYSRISTISICFLLSLIVFCTACKKNPVTNNPITYGNSSVADFTTDKAIYAPGQTVTFTLNKDIPAGAKIRYRKLAETIAETTFSSKSWQWITPSSDFTGYMVDVYTLENGQEKIQASTGVDVSSDYSKFPRNGFLSKFGEMTNGEMQLIVSNLNRYHINVLQFYDWQYKHHLPLAGSLSTPAAQWKDIANRDTYLSTVKEYVDAAHSFGMKSLFYNLAYGALSDAASDGVPSQWYAYKDANQTNRDYFPLGSPFKSSIYLLDPSNPGWQQYISSRNNDVYSVFNFDGYQVDQLGDRGSLFTATGNTLNLSNTFQPFLQAMKNASPSRRLVMNAVNQYGQQSIAQSPVDFLYTEVWNPNDGYKDLANIIQYNDGLTASTKKTVLAAYMNYDLANSSGYFNTPGVLLTDAVIFAFGGSHLELGEHMLGKEYFPNNNLQMKTELKSAITSYYDFLVGYENLLRDGGSFNTPSVTCSNNKMVLNTWPPQTGQVSIVGKNFTNSQVLHFLNFTNATSMNWRDANGIQAAPNTITGAKIDFTSTRTVNKVWYASPDDSGIARQLTFTQADNVVSFTIPSLQYWDMVVVEYQ